MAKTVMGAILGGIQGKVGNAVFRRWRGVYVIGQRPVPTGRPPTAAQAQQRARFTKAIRYAERAMKDPRLKQLYEAQAKGGRLTATNVAVVDWFTAPVIEDIDLSAYHGEPGEPIYILATDDVEVLSVGVEIRDASGTLVESGMATEVSPGGGLWLYTATASCKDTPQVTATASDNPGNKTIQQTGSIKTEASLASAALEPSNA